MKILPAQTATRERVSLREAVKSPTWRPTTGSARRIERLPDAFFDGIARLDLHRIACRVADAFRRGDRTRNAAHIVRDTFCFDIPVVRVDDGIWASRTLPRPTMAFKDVARASWHASSHFIEGRDDEHLVTVLRRHVGRHGRRRGQRFRRRGHRRSGALPQRARKRHSGRSSSRRWDATSRRWRSRARSTTANGWSKAPLRIRRLKRRMRLHRPTRSTWRGSCPRPSISSTPMRNCAHRA